MHRVFGLSLPQAMSLPLSEFILLSQSAQRIRAWGLAEEFVIFRAAVHADEQNARRLLDQLRRS